MKKLLTVFSLFAILALPFGCSSSSDDNGSNSNNNNNNNNNPDPGDNEVDFWLTTGDGSAKLALQNTVLVFDTSVNSYNTIEVSDSDTYQNVDGFGYTLTGGSAEVINGLTDASRQALLNDLFNTGTGIGVSYLRISIGASDMNDEPFSYDDMPAGQTDVNLDNFSLSNDSGLISLLQEILAINPNIKIVATPWSAPTWMKDNGSFINGSLKPEYYDAYAQYFVKYIQGMQDAGISITAVTPQNEPLNPYNNPSMVMTATEEGNFIKNNLGPAFQSAGLATKIIVYDHNCDVPSYPLSILNDAQASQYVDGSAFHLYAGDISALSTVHSAHPEKNLYFTEQYTPSNGSFSGDLTWHLKNVIIGSMRNWSKNALEWNLATNGSYGPHTNGGCSNCQGAITVISSENYTKNVSYYIVAQASKFVPAGSVRIGSNIQGSLNNVAFKRPDGKHVLIVENDGAAATTFNVKYNGAWFTTSLQGSSVGTYVW